MRKKTFYYIIHIGHTLYSLYQGLHYCIKEYTSYTHIKFIKDNMLVQRHEYSIKVFHKNIDSCGVVYNTNICKDMYNVYIVQ